MAKLLLLLALYCSAMPPMAPASLPDTLALLDPAEEELSLAEADAEQMDGLLLEERAATGGNETPLEEGSGEEPFPVEALLEAAAMQQAVEEQQQLANGTESGEQIGISNGRQKTAASPKERCQPNLDLVFLLDTSGSIEQLFQEHVRWAVTLVESLPLEKDMVRVAAVQYAGFPLTEFALGTYPSAEDIRQHLQRVQFQSGVTRTGYALRKAESELFRPDRGARTDAAKVVVLFTDGLSVDDPMKPAKQLRELKHVKIFVVSIAANETFGAELNRIAGHEENIFGPQDLPRLREALLTEAERARACSRIGDDAFSSNSGPRGNGISGGFGLIEDREDEENANNDNDDGEDPIVRALAGEPKNGTFGEDMKMDGEKMARRPLAMGTEQIDDAEDMVDPAEMLGLDEEETTVGTEEQQHPTVTTLPTLPVPKDVHQLPVEEDSPPLDEWGLRQGVQQAIERTVAEGQAKTAAEDTNIQQTLAVETTTLGTTITEAATPLVDSSTTASPPEERDVFEPDEGQQLPRHRPRPLIGISSVTGRPSTLPRTFPVRVELPSAITRRPKPGQPPVAFGGRLNELKVSAFKLKEFPGASISKTLMKTPMAASRIITAAVATSTQPTSTRRTSSTTTVTAPSTKTLGQRLRSSTTTASSTTTKTTPNWRRTTTTTLATVASTFSTSTPTRTVSTTRTTTTTSRTRPRAFGTQQVVCPPVDLLFILDSSGSVHSVYENQKEWLESVLAEIQLGSDGQAGGHRVALLQFAGVDLQKTEWQWDRFRDNAHMMDAFHQVRHLTGTTYIGQALVQSIQLLEQRRRQVPTLVVLLSDGFSQDDALQPAQTLRQLPNLQFYTLSIGQLSNKELLLRLVGDPSHVFIGAQAADLLRAQLLRRIRCA